MPGEAVRVHTNQRRDAARDHLTWAEIDLDAIAANVRALGRRLGDRVKLVAVVKANAYGHGAVRVAEEVLANGASSLGVARVVEGLCLRKSGIDAPILILGYTRPADAKDVVKWNLTPTVTTLETAEALSAAAQDEGIELPVQVKVDTGMVRAGRASMASILRLMSDVSWRSSQH